MIYLVVFESLVDLASFLSAFISALVSVMVSSLAWIFPCRLVICWSKVFGGARYVWREEYRKIGRGED